MSAVNFGFFNECKIDNITYFPITKWIEKELSYDDGLYVVNKIGNWSFFQSYEKLGLDKLEFLEFLEKSLRAKKDIHVYEQVVEKLKLIAPTEFGCDANLYAKDIYYRTWFLLRDSFFKVISDALLSEHQSKRDYFVWNALSDMHSHQDCLDLHNKVFIIDNSFIAFAEQHWAKARSGCRCDLSVLNERQLSKHNLKAP
ncbi:structural protein [Acinetobacter bohemicus]|uniref:hypothetical protein n=1 Tax=Acinetobacter bohemicus TaxID=1435036 RepID=UPI00192B6AC4|nr:hypothetical protein [Acinetobacter bohemicus]CAD9195571.1 hypothetical protein QAC21B_01697 [Acinetobacter bohemicus]